MEASMGSNRLTPKDKYFPNISKMTPGMEDEDSGYLSSFHGSESNSSSKSRRFSWPRKDLLVSPTDIYWCKIMPKTVEVYEGLVGHEYVDMLYWLKNYPHLLKKVLNQLQPDDLVRCCLVSRAWRDACLHDPRASTRRKFYLSGRGLGDKENFGKPDDCQLKIQPPLLRSFSTPLASITSSRQLHFCTTPSSSPIFPSKSTTDRFNLFVQAGQQLSAGKGQMSCPRCSLPSRVDQEVSLGQCTQPHCRFQFCLLCLCEQHVNTPCPVMQPPVRCKWPKSLNKSSSRKNLRRL